MKKVAIIGAGVVGSVAAYYLSKSPNCQVTVFDDGVGQATKAAAGIISPWFSKRRNKAWYKLARLGADFYQELTADLQAAGFSTDFYQQTGVCILKKEEEKLQELYKLALKRREESPLIGDLAILNKEQIQQIFPSLQGFEQALFAAGGARVEGALLTKTLLEASGATVISRKVSLQEQEMSYQIADRTFDIVVLAAGAWLGQLLQPLGYEVDVRPQKGQLRDFQIEQETADYPVVMPEGELDIIPFPAGKISIGASHENDQAFDLSADKEILDRLQAEAELYLPFLAQAAVVNERVGTRAYTSDFSPFFGKVPQTEHLYAASGLGSSGLTTGPLIGYQLAQMILSSSLPLAAEDYSVEPYIRKIGD